MPMANLVYVLVAAILVIVLVKVLAGNRRRPGNRRWVDRR